jgi:hypothetical protein
MVMNGFIRLYKTHEFLACMLVWFASFIVIAAVVTLFGNYMIAGWGAICGSTIILGIVRGWVEGKIKTERKTSGV